MRDSLREKRKKDDAKRDPKKITAWECAFMLWLVTLPLCSCQSLLEMGAAAGGAAGGALLGPGGAAVGAVTSIALVKAAEADELKEELVEVKAQARDPLMIQEFLGRFWWAFAVLGGLILAALFAPQPHRKR